MVMRKGILKEPNAINVLKTESREKKKRGKRRSVGPPVDVDSQIKVKNYS